MLPIKLKLIFSGFWLATVMLTILLTGPSYGADTGIEGQVLFRGQPYSGVYVEAFESSVSMSATKADAAGAANTGSDGRYSITLPPGSYRVTAKKRPEGPGSGGMLYAATGDDPVVVGSGMVVLTPLSLSDSGGGRSSGTGEIQVTGTVFSQGKPLAGAYVYFYPGSSRRGPGYIARARTGDGGSYEAALSPGSYTVTVRFGWAGEGMGTVGVRDLVGEYPESPVAVSEEAVDLGRVDMHPVDPETWKKSRWAAAISSRAAMSIRGQVVDESSQPVPGAYVFLYDDHRMVGKPYAISPPTEADGRYSLPVDKPGTYYLGARTHFGGPVEPGELMGAWGGDSAEPVLLKADGDPSPSLDIVVREVW